MDAAVERLLDLALAEDLGNGDLTTEAFVPQEARSGCRIVSRGTGVLAGMEVALAVLRRLEPELEIAEKAEDGTSLRPGQIVLAAEGRTAPLLTAERTALNFLQRLSGIASLTRRYRQLVAGLPVQLLDTRKTTPGWRLLEKAAVVAGGGINHRMGLYDGVMVKDNHLVFLSQDGDLQQGIHRLRERHPGIPIELEVDTLEQLERFLQLEGVDVILLDNMEPDTLRQAVQLTQGRVKLEASGGITEETLRAKAETGVDFISIGALTHSARALDLSLELHPL
ncbi:MAG: carboxylating nicotinate-nucleotide diphosphorylase [Verrucomicrobiota bacterium]